MKRITALIPVLFISIFFLMLPITPDPPPKIILPDEASQPIPELPYDIIDAQMY